MNILSQKRELFTKERLTEEEITNIRKEVENRLNGERRGNDIVAPTTATEELETEQTEQIDQRILNTYQANNMLYNGMQPGLKPKLPRLKGDKRTKEILAAVNKILARELRSCSTFEALHAHLYTAAMTSIMMHDQQIKKPEDTNQGKSKMLKHPWQTRLENKISSLRRDIGRLTQAPKQISNKKLQEKVHNIFKKYKNNENNTLIKVSDFLKQKLTVYVARLKRYKESERRRNENRLFKTNQKLFYRSMNNKTDDNSNNQMPENEHVLEFWKHIWENEVTHHHHASWINTERNRVERVQVMSQISITEEDVKHALKRAHNWKTPGVDSLHNFWLKKLCAAHAVIAKLFNDSINNPDTIPDFMTTGVTYLLPKTTSYSLDPSKYRPITCLPTIYKIFTSIIADKLYKHLEENAIFSEEQKGCRRNSRGCKEQLIADLAIMEEAKKNKRDLYSAYIDYCKAFDSVPHSWLKEVLMVYKVNPTLIKLLSELMSRWKTTLSIRSKPIGQVSINRGIFQGDSLSALWFCLALQPLTTMLQETEMGYLIPGTGYQLSHLFYMDDLKLMSKSIVDLKKLLNTTEEFSRDIRMEFGLDKCKINAMRRGKWEEVEGYQMQQNSAHILPLEEDETYKYLGMQQARGINKTYIKTELIGKFKDRLHSVLYSKLSGSNIVKAVNTYAAPVVSYSFGILKWTPTDLEELNRLIRTTCTQQRMKHPKSSVQRFHLDRKRGGRGFVDFRNIHHNEVYQLRQYFQNKTIQSPLHAAICQIDKNLTPLKLSDQQFDPSQNKITEDMKILAWKGMKLHGRYIAQVDEDHIDKNATHAWLKEGTLFPETEGFLMAIQDQVIATKNYRKYIMGDITITDSKCRMCGTGSENVEHIIAGCKVLAPTDYLRRHNNVAKIIHSKLCHKLLNMPLIPYYMYKPEAVIETPRFKIYWDRTVVTDRTVEHNRPDIVIQDRERKCTYLVEIAVPAPANIKTKLAEKTTKYLPLANDIKDTWKQERVTVVPIVIGATGEIPKSLHKSIETLDLGRNTYLQLQKAVILDTCHTVRKVLNN